ncbi:M48 family metallopeptidase [Nocardioides panacisoli]|uniref:M48 family metallopeptidase n=1 Tax=Nocardioides panacisoli TaxID=627624 RepID=UPI001C62FAA8|nr:M48 family metallopeptidase [Nocardioides panacisoli]QYJ04538.1 M48 family metallopeptidase [Nocardioides panacisoli]
MDFFERQRSVRTSSTRLVLLFLLAVVLIVVVIDGVFLLALAQSDPSPDPQRLLGTGAVVAAVVVGMIGVVSVVRILALRAGGGAAVARKLGAVPLEELASTPALVRYRNVVEEVAIASATPVPQLFVMPEEPGINAFAAGSTPADAAVAVTQGTLDRLNRDELQAVIGHEFSHIVNGDMRLSMRLIGVLAGITVLGVIGRILLYSGGTGGGRRNNGAAAFMIAGLVILVVGSIGVFFARLIKAAISRQREYLADASAVQYTRQTEGLAGALKKIGGLEDGSRLRSGRVEDVSHMLFGEGLDFSSMFATHPPLVERIRQLEPGFEPAEVADLQRQWRRTPPDGMAEDAALGLAGPGEARPATESAVTPGAPRDLRGTVGNPTEESFRAGAELLAAIPAPLLDAARRPDLVLGLVHGLLLSSDPDVRQAQYELVVRGHGRDVADQAWQAGESLEGIDAACRLPLAELAFPALRAHGRDEVRTVIAVVGDLIGADQRVSVFEYCLGTLLWTQMSEFLTGRPPWPTRSRRLADCRPAAAALLSAVAAAGHGTDAERTAAFDAGASVLLPGQDLAYAPPAELPALDAAWGDLDGLQGEEKARLVDALVATARADDAVRVAELELVRTVCGVLHCPIPPAMRGRR